MPNPEVKLNESQTNALVDALGVGIVQSIKDLEDSCPELGSILTRALLLEGFKNAKILNGCLIIDTSYLEQ